MLTEQEQAFEQRIASLLDALQTGTNAEWDTSEPYCIGGLGSAAGLVYSCRAPYIGDCEYAADIASVGTVASQVVISSSPKKSGIDFVGTSVPGYSDGMFDGYVINLPAGPNTVPVDSQWYQVRNSENTIYVLVVNAGGGSAVVNVQFRQKRK